MANGDAVTARNGIRPFLDDARDQIVAEWRSAVERLPSAAATPTQSLVELAPELLEQIADLAEVARGESLDRTFEIARREVPRELGKECSGARIVAECSALRHDLRNPLNTIQVTAATTLAQTSGEQRWRRHLEIIHRSCLRMAHLIADLLDMVSIGAGRLSIEIRPERADDVLREAFELHQPLAAEKRISLVLRGFDEAVIIDCDRQRVLQVFENLVGNSLKFCRAGDTVTLSGERTDGPVRFTVEDTGPGVRPELLDRLFDPYWSGPDSPGGVGLGLYIARGIVERHGGRIEIDSAVGRGARFSFTIPVAGRTPSRL